VFFNMVVLCGREEWVRRDQTRLSQTNTFNMFFLSLRLCVGGERRRKGSADNRKKVFSCPERESQAVPSA